MFSQQRKQLVGNWKSGASQSFVCEARRPYQVGCSTQCFFASCFVSIVLIILLKVCLVLIPINGTVKSGQQPFPTPCSLKKILTWQRQMRNNYIQNQRMKIMHKTENMNHNLSTINKFYKNQSKDHTVRTRKRSKTLRKDMNQRTAQHIPILTENTLDAAPSSSCAPKYLRLNICSTRRIQLPLPLRRRRDPRRGGEAAESATRAEFAFRLRSVLLDN